MDMADDANQLPNIVPPIPPKDDDWQGQYNQGGKFKEAVDQFAGGRAGGKEAEPLPAGGGEGPVESVVEVPSEPEVSKEVEGYVEKVEKAAELKTPITDDYTGQVLMKPAQPQDTTVTLPLTEEQVRDGLHHKVLDSFRWLAEWCVRQIKMLHGKVRYKK